ncbi:hypothetical protein COLO4_07685 [Corchorus olitorius]|uniref:HAT C-terminal dimerisation domain-containing protein n=1 Tax=Corchorus olitorius TaxID=93759 RepID=A0A1R3KIX0_9ROSI|nr:hypothetical protein COLO4_07685 [Corchorus olitorius]
MEEYYIPPPLFVLLQLFRHIEIDESEIPNSKTGTGKPKKESRKSISESKILDSFRPENLNPKIDADLDEGEMQDLGIAVGFGPSGSSGKPPLDPSSNKRPRTSTKTLVVWDYVTTFEGPAPNRNLMASSLLQTVQDAMYELFQDYKKVLSPNEKVLQMTKIFASVGVGLEDNDNSAMDMFWKHEMESGKEENRTELDVYLQEDREKKREDFDILIWWKIKSPRSCLAAKHVQALVCGQDWLRGSLDFNPAAEMEEQSEFDKLAQELKEVSIDPVIDA